MTELLEKQAASIAAPTPATDPAPKAETDAPAAVPAPSAETAASAAPTSQERDSATAVSADCSDGLGDCGGDCCDVTDAAAEDVAALAAEDVAALTRLFPEAGIASLADIDAPARFAELRMAGLSAEEAYLATNFSRLMQLRENLHRESGKGHMRSARVAGVCCAGRMPPAELLQARDIFGDLPDKEIERLYRKVQP